MVWMNYKLHMHFYAVILVVVLCCQVSFQKIYTCYNWCLGWLHHPASHPDRLLQVDFDVHGNSYLEWGYWRVCCPISFSLCLDMLSIFMPFLCSFPSCSPSMESGSIFIWLYFYLDSEIHAMIDFVCFHLYYWSEDCQLGLYSYCWGGIV